MGGRRSIQQTLGRRSEKTKFNLCPVGGDAETLRHSSLPKVTELMEMDVRIKLRSPDTRRETRCLP